MNTVMAQQFMQIAFQEWNVAYNIADTKGGNSA